MSLTYKLEMTLDQYTKFAATINAVNPRHRAMVKRWYIANRTVDYWVDRACLNEDAGKEKLVVHANRKEEEAFNRLLRIEDELPAREITNANRQYADLHKHEAVKH